MQDYSRYERIMNDLISSDPISRCKINCIKVSEKINNIMLPDIKNFESKMNKYGRFVKAPKDYYELALVFSQLHDIFDDIKVNHPEIVEINEIMRFLSYFDGYYFELVEKYKQRKIIKEYAELYDSTRILKHHIKRFIKKYSFLFKNKEDFMDLDENI